MPSLSTLTISSLLLFLTYGIEAARVKHIIAIMMENHSFDNMLGWLPNVDGVNATGKCNTFQGKTYCATTRGAYSDPDPDHSVGGTAEQIFGSSTFPPGNEHNPSSEIMSGFISSYAKAHGNATLAPTIMDCFTPDAVPVISTLAQEYTVIDTYHASVPACTFPNRLFQLSGTSYGYADNDDVMTALGWPQESIFNRLSSAGITWRVYYTDVPSALLMRDARNLTDINNYRSIDQFEKDALAGDLPFFTWVEPGFMALPGQPETDQHPAADVADGERWMKKAYEALRASPLWNESVMLITYDEHGGFYDGVSPLNVGVPSPDNRPCIDCGQTPFSFTRLGIRVPMVVVSPWSDKGRIVHTPASPSGGAYEHSSLPATLAALVPGFGEALTARAAWAIPLHSLWENTNMTLPRSDCPMTLPNPPTQTPSQIGIPHDGSTPASELQRLMVLLAEGAARTLSGNPMSEEEAANLESKLEEEGVFKTGAIAAMRAMGRIQEMKEAAAIH
jgi:phospholipase C